MQCISKIWLWMEKSKEYELKEAVSVLKTFNKTKFDETVDIVMKLGVDPKHSDQIVRGSFSLPKGIGKEVRVVVFASGDKIELAQKAGAVEAGGDDLLKKVEGGWTSDLSLWTLDLSLWTSDLSLRTSDLSVCGHPI